MQPGMTVRLKSGGPLMTIKERSDSGGWICVWFDGADPKKGVFDDPMLNIE